MNYAPNGIAIKLYKNVYTDSVAGKAMLKQYVARGMGIKNSKGEDNDRTET